LRFICPVIVKPREYQILDLNPTPEKVQDLIMVAKVLQTLANSTKFGKKEEYMVPLNPFLEENNEIIKEYFLALIDLGNGSGSLREMEIDEGYVSALDQDHMNGLEYDPSSTEDMVTQFRKSVNDNIENEDFYGQENNLSSNILEDDNIQGLILNGIPRCQIPPRQVQTYMSQTLPEGFVAVPEYPVFKGINPLDNYNYHPTSVLYKQVMMLMLKLGSQFRKLVASPSNVELKESEVRAFKSMSSSDVVYHIVQELFMEENGPIEENSRRSRKLSSVVETKTVQFLRLLLSNDMVFVAMILDLLEIAIIDPVISNLVYIFNTYNRVSQLLRFSVAHELATIFRKWEGK